MLVFPCNNYFKLNAVLSQCNIKMISLDCGMQLGFDGIQCQILSQDNNSPFRCTGLGKIVYNRPIMRVKIQQAHKNKGTVLKEFKTCYEIITYLHRKICIESLYCTSL